MNLNWKNTLYPHTRNFTWEQFHKLANDLGYMYFAWNGLIYETESLTEMPRVVEHLDEEVTRQYEERREIALTYVKSTAINANQGELIFLHRKAVEFADKLIAELHK